MIMKKFFMILVFTLMMFSFNNVYALNERLATKYNENIDSVSVSIPATIKVIKGDSLDNFMIQINTSDDVVKRSIIHEVKDGILYIRPVNIIKYEEMEHINPKDIRIRIVSPNNKLNIGTRKGFTITSSDKKDDSGNSTI